MELVIKLQISQKHIDNGVRGCPLRCPIGQALAEIGYPNHTVGDTGVQIRERLYIVDYSIDETGQQFVKSVDKGEPVAPCCIVLSCKVFFTYKK